MMIMLRWQIFYLISGILFLVGCASTNDQVDTPSFSIPQTLSSIMADFLIFLPKLLSALVMFVASIYLANLFSRLLRRFIEKRRADPGIALLIYHISRWGILLLGTATAMRQVEFELTAFLAGLGILGFTIGFALQDISQNLVAGLLLLIQRPFELGELIEVNGYRGRVQSIDLRATELLTQDSHNVLIPNATVFTQPIINFNRQPHWRLNLKVGVAYDSDLDKVQRVTLQAVRALPDVLDDPAPTLHYHTFNDFSIDFTLHFWVDARVTNPMTATHPVIVAIQRAYTQSGIEIPFPAATQIRLPEEKTSAKKMSEHP